MGDCTIWVSSVDGGVRIIDRPHNFLFPPCGVGSGYVDGGV